MTTKSSLYTLLLGAAILGSGSYAYTNFHPSKRQTPPSDTLLANIEALSDGESSESGNNNFRYPQKDGKAEKCTLFKYISLSGEGSFTSTDGGLEGKLEGKYIKTTITGLLDTCPIENGDGCNPFSCQEVPY